MDYCRTGIFVDRGGSLYVVSCANLGKGFRQGVCIKRLDIDFLDIYLIELAILGQTPAKMFSLRAAPVQRCPMLLHVQTRASSPLCKLIAWWGRPATFIFKKRGPVSFCFVFI